MAFLAMVINCAAAIERKSEKIVIIGDTPRRFLCVVGVSGETVQQLLREAFRLFQTPEGVIILFSQWRF